MGLITPQKIVVKRGNEVNLPILADGEFAVTLDTKKLYLGISGTNYCIGAVSSIGDMLKSIYDTDNDGVVDNAENAQKVGGRTLTSGTANPSGGTDGDLYFQYSS